MKSAVWTASLVGAGGFFGSLLRYALGGLIHRQLPLATFPYGTLAVNVIGCLAIGILAGLSEARPMFGPGFRLFALVGLLGGFTTFSTFGYETVAMMRDQEYVRALTNVTLHFAVALPAVWVGYLVAVSR